MKQKLIILASVFLLMVVEVTAQKKYIPIKELTTESNSLNYKLPGKQYYNMIVPSGTVFLYNDWKDGYVKLINGDRYDSLSLKYNIYYDELIHINNRSLIMIMLDKDVISEFGFYNQNNEPSIFKKMYYPGTPKGEYYFQELYNNRLKLLIWSRSIEEQTSPYKDSYGILRSSQYNVHSRYYLVFPDGRFEKFNLKRRSFLSMFPDDKKTVRHLLRKNHIFFNNDKQTIQAVKLVEETLYSDR